MLSLDGHQVTLAADGDEGIALFRQGDYDIVFTDLGMPGLSGWNVARALKDHRSDVPVFMVTGWGAGLDQSEIDRHGVDGVIAKPFDMEELLELVRRQMEDGG